MQSTKAIAATLATVMALTITLPAAAQSAGERGPGARDDRGGHHAQGERSRRNGPSLDGMLEQFDTNGDGGITQAEIDAVRSARLAEFDADGDGQLTLAEYEALWLDAMRERMVDRFQSHDDDGDAVITIAEFGERSANIVDRRDRNDDGVLNADDMRGDRGPAAEAPAE